MLVYLVLMYDSASQEYYVLKPPITNMDIELLVSLEPDEPGARITVNVMFKPTREKGRAIGSKFNCALHVGGRSNCGWGSKTIPFGTISRGYPQSTEACSTRVSKCMQVY